MRIWLDDEELALADDVIAEGKEEIYEEVKRIASTRGRIITGMVLDGEAIDDFDVFVLVVGGQEVVFNSQSVRELVIETIAEGAEYLPALLNGLGSIAAKLETGSDKEAQNMLADAVEGINWLFSVFERSCALLGIAAESFTSGNLAEEADVIRGILEEMTSVMESGKNLELAFVIRDRLIPAMERFRLYWGEVARTLEAPLQ
jgi:hypothetical protein